MADQKLVEAIKSGNEALNRYRAKSARAILDLAEADLSGTNLSGMSFDGADMRRANLEGCNLNRTAFVGTCLVEANLSHASMYQTVFREADLTGANLEGCSNFNADLDKQLSRSTEFERSRLDEANFQSAILPSSNFNDTSCLKTDFTSATLENCSFHKAVAKDAIFRESRLAGASLVETDLESADVHSADFLESKFYGPKLRHLKNASSARNLESTDVSSERARPLYFDHCIRDWVDRYCDWESLRTFGRMPLFGLSYSVLIFIPAYCYVIAWYNSQIERFRSASLDSSAGGFHAQIAITHHLEKLPLPSLSLLLLGSTLLLAIASTIYTFFCPPRVKEFTRDVWCDQLGRPLVHYWPYSWKYRRIRMACGILYVLGGSGALIVLGTKVWKAGVYIVEHAVL